MVKSMLFPIQIDILKKATTNVSVAGLMFDCRMVEFTFHLNSNEVSELK